MTIYHSEDYRNRTIEIILGKGDSEKKWTGELEICPNPTCQCNYMTFKLFEAENGEGNTFPKHCFSLDVFSRKAVKLKGANATSKEDFRFAKSFAKDLSESDWNELRRFYMGYKRSITDSTPITELSANFPEKEIETEGAMIGYYEILPYAEQISICLDDVSYLIDDQFCLSSKCSCKDAVLTFLPMKNGQALKNINQLAIFFNYRKKSWRIASNGPENIATPDELVKEILGKHLEKKLEERHKNLRAIYKNYRKMKQEALKRSLQKSQLFKDPVVQEKIGRNTPCPCGSGKKYKKCCMLKK